MLKVFVHGAEEGGYLAEIPGMSGCATQADSLEELRINIGEAIEGCRLADEKPPEDKEKDGKRKQGMENPGRLAGPPA